MQAKQWPFGFRRSRPTGNTWTPRRLAGTQRCLAWTGVCPCTWQAGSGQGAGTRAGGSRAGALGVGCAFASVRPCVSWPLRTLSSLGGGLRTAQPAVRCGTLNLWTKQRRLVPALGQSLGADAGASGHGKADARQAAPTQEADPSPLLAPPSSQSLEGERPAPLAGAPAPPGAPVLAAFLAPGGARLWLVARRAPYTLGALLRFSPAALGGDGARRLLLWQALFSGSGRGPSTCKSDDAHGQRICAA